MDVSYSDYDYKRSIERIDEILSSSSKNYSEHNGVPNRTNLTYTNGYYVDVTVLFVDIRDSKGLSKSHTKPVLAKIYRAYISEVVAVIKGNRLVKEVYIEGDGIWAVFNTGTRKDVGSVLGTAARISSIIDILNLKLSKLGYKNIKVGIGIDDAEALYIKAGYNGSGINEVVWIGKVVGQAAHFCSLANKDGIKRIAISPNVHHNLPQDDKAFFDYDLVNDIWHCDVINLVMNGWINDNRDYRALRI